MSASESTAPAKGGTWVADMKDWLEKMQAGDVPPAPVAALLGMRLVRVEQGSAVAELQADPTRHANPMGTLHGGILCDLADMAMGVAMGSTLGEGESFTTLELKANYFKPVWDARLTATARMVKRTRSTAFIECDVVDEKQSLVARVSSTCMVLRGEMASGR
ncbi:MAG: PaaI family thioesterase [Myxococcaceae bacterium]|nr:PaaI family thioesterase [Myxococcaceae bacterium]